MTIVEFFDPACETCRVFYPFVKELLAKYPADVRLVIRYAPFHQASAEVIMLLEAAKRQGKFQAVLDSVLSEQPAWANHDRPDPRVAFRAAEQAGLHLKKVMEDWQRPEVEAALKQDLQDLTALQVTKTPTFFVNERSLHSFSPAQLEQLVVEEIAKSKK